MKSRFVENGQLKEPDKIGAAAATKLRRNRGHRYFDWELRHGKFRFFVFEAWVSMPTWHEPEISPLLIAENIPLQAHN
jgi:hypothetical protein